MEEKDIEYRRCGVNCPEGEHLEGHLFRCPRLTPNRSSFDPEPDIVHWGNICKIPELRDNSDKKPQHYQHEGHPYS
jgi:hypothetical protein